MLADFQRRFCVSLLLTIPIVLLSPMVVHMLKLPYSVDFPWAANLVLGLSTVVFFYGGWPFLRGFYAELLKLRPGMMTLIGVATTVAYSFSVAVSFGLAGEALFWELATLIDIMLLGHWIEMKSVLGASRALQALVQLLPAEAHLISADGSLREVPVSSLLPGDRILIKPGERVPADGLVFDGQSSVNEAMLTGESAPVSKATGAKLIGGSINGEGAISAEVTRIGAQSYLAQVIELVQQAQQSRSRAQDLANRAAFFLTIVSLGGGLITLLAWLGQGQGLAFAIERMVTVMVIACPHALGLAVPLVVAVSTSIAAQNGLLIRDRSAFERARSLDAVVFDKTGTLTMGQFGVTDVIAVGAQTETELLALAAAVESQSEHPIAAAVLQVAQARGIAVPVPSGFAAIPGRGAQAQVEGREIKVASPGYLAELGLKSSDPRIATVADQGKTVVYVIEGKRLLGAIALADMIKPDSTSALQRLRELGLKVLMLTGDALPVARWVSSELQLDDYFAQVLPHEKAARIEEVRGRGLRVAMVGDGVNDAPALAAADLGIAIGAGSDVAIETADVVLVHSNPLDVARIIALSRATYRKMLENLWWAAGYNIVAIPLAAGLLHSQGITLTPAAGAVLMSLSTIVVAINARRLRLN